MTRTHEYIEGIDLTCKVDCPFKRPNSKKWPCVVDGQICHKIPKKLRMMFDWPTTTTVVAGEIQVEENKEKIGTISDGTFTPKTQS